MHTWMIWGINLEALYIDASSFDEALAAARKVHRGYSSGQIVK